MNKYTTLLFAVLFSASAITGYVLNRKLNATKLINKELENKVLAQQQLVDSLRNEDFIHSTNETRYGIALDWLKEESPSCAEKLEEILRTRTE